MDAAVLFFIIKINFRSIYIIQFGGRDNNLYNVEVSKIYVAR